MNGFALGVLAALALLLVARLVRRALLRRRLGLRVGHPPRWALRGLFRRLGTRPEQEAVIAAEADALAAELSGLREEGRALREEVAVLLAGPALDAPALEAALASRLERLARLRATAAAGLARVHGALDAAQRERLAALVRGGLRPAHACARRR